MATASVRLETAHGDHYLRELCRHWSPIVPVVVAAGNGRIELPGAVCILDADPEGLGVRLEAADHHLARMEDVIADRLKRFALREDLRFAWVETG